MVIESHFRLARSIESYTKICPAECTIECHSISSDRTGACRTDPTLSLRNARGDLRAHRTKHTFAETISSKRKSVCDGLATSHSSAQATTAQDTSKQESVPIQPSRWCFSMERRNAVEKRSRNIGTRNLAIPQHFPNGEISFSQ